MKVGPTNHSHQKLRPIFKYEDQITTGPWKKTQHTLLSPIRNKTQLKTPAKWVHRKQKKKKKRKRSKVKHGKTGKQPPNRLLPFPYGTRNCNLVQLRLTVCNVANPQSHLSTFSVGPTRNFSIYKYWWPSKHHNQLITIQTLHFLSEVSVCFFGLLRKQSKKWHKLEQWRPWPWWLWYWLWW